MPHKKKETTLSQESIDRFRNSLRGKGRSEQTAKAYTTDLRIFLSEIGDDTISEAEFEEVGMNWLTANRNTLAAKTTGRRLTSLRAFAKWAGWGAILEDYTPPIPLKGQPHP